MAIGVHGFGNGNRMPDAAAGGVGNLARLVAQSPSPVQQRVPSSGAARAVRSPTSVAGFGGGSSTREIARVKSLVSTEVLRSWQDYSRQYPEAFKSTTGISTQLAPRVVFYPTQAAFAKAMGRSATESTVAMVDSKKPNIVNINMENLLKYSAVRGDGYVRAAVAHELVHSLAAPFSLRMFKDGDPLSETALAKSLNQEFSLDPTNRPRQHTTFTVERMINEFSADYFSAKATGIQPFNAAYGGIRDIGLQTLNRVGEATWRKAIFENDTAAYQQVVAAALAVRQNYLPKEESGSAGLRGSP